MDLAQRLQQAIMKDANEQGVEIGGLKNGCFGPAVRLLLACVTTDTELMSRRQLEKLAYQAGAVIKIDTVTQHEYLCFPPGAIYAFADSLGRLI